MENNYKAALEAEKLAAQEKLGMFEPGRMTLVKGWEVDPVGLGLRNTRGHGWAIARL